VTRTSHIVMIPPNRHSADQKVRYCRIARRGGRLLISQQKQFPELCSGSAVVTASTALTTHARRQIPQPVSRECRSTAGRRIAERISSDNPVSVAKTA
jgi:hypothetical protein